MLVYVACVIGVIFTSCDYWGGSSALTNAWPAHLKPSHSSRGMRASRECLQFGLNFSHVSPIRFE